MNFGNMKLVILLKASVLSYVLPKIHENKAPVLQTFLEDNSPQLPLFQRDAPNCGWS